MLKLIKTWDAWSHTTSFPGFSPTRSVGRVGENPGNEAGSHTVFSLGHVVGQQWTSSYFLAGWNLAAASKGKTARGIFNLDTTDKVTRYIMLPVKRNFNNQWLAVSKLVYFCVANAQLQMHNCYRQMTWNKWNKSHLRPLREKLGNLRKSGVHNPESAILILSLRNGFFTDQVISSIIF